MVPKPSHRWAFKRGMRAGAFGWRGSVKVIERLRSASSEIQVAESHSAEKRIELLSEFVRKPEVVSGLSQTIDGR